MKAPFKPMTDAAIRKFMRNGDSRRVCVERLRIRTGYSVERINAALGTSCPTDD